MAVRILQEDQKNKGSGLRSSHGPGPEESGPMVVMVNLGDLHRGINIIMVGRAFKATLLLRMAILYLHISEMAL